jgi:hypothetical protein
MQVNHNTKTSPGSGDEIADQVITMHQMGYELDFYETGQGLACLQNGLSFPWNQLILERLSCEEDFLERGAAQIYAVETLGGHKGLLLTRKIAYLSRKAS